MDRQILAGMLIGVAVISGCVSIEKTRTQMSSSDKSDIQKAEETIFTVAAKGSDSTGLMSFDTTQRLEFLNLSSNPELMKRIAEGTSNAEVFKAAADKLDLAANQETFEQIADKTEDINMFAAVLEKVDFKQPGVGMKFLTKVFDKQFTFYRNGRYDSVKNYWEWLTEKEESAKNSSYSSRRGAVTISEDDEKPGIPPTAALAAKLVSGMTEEELVKILTDSKLNYHYWEGQHAPGYLEVPRIEGAASVQLIRVTQSPETLFKMLNNTIRMGHTYKGENLSPAVVKKIFMLADKITDPVLAERIYDKFQRNEVWRKSGDMNLIMVKMPEDKIMECALNGVKWQRYGQGGWKNGDMEYLEMSMGAASSLKDRANVLKLLKAIFAKVDEIKKDIEKDAWVSWNESDDNRVERLQTLMPALSDAEIVELALTDHCWRYIKDKITADAAYGMLTGGKATSSSMEIALLGRLPSEKVDLAVWESMTTEKGKSAAYTAMTPENKQLADKANEAYIKAILAKSDEAAKTTMSLKGFYLGMDFKDAKALFAYYFPDEAITEKTDGEGEKANYCFTTSNQKRDPFCYASVKDGKVWQFNFGRKVLADWFKYDAARYSDWAEAFSREHGIELKLDFLSRDERTLVAAGMDGMAINWEEILVTLHQTIWTYKNAAKQFRITYFDDPDITAFGGGVWGEEAAFNKYKYISAQGGTLRIIQTRD